MSSRADAYAAWARSGADGSFPPVLAAVRELLPPAPAHVLDVGCGEGRLGRALREDGYDVEQVDADETMAGLAGGQVADATALPFEDGSFDAVTLVHVLMELEDVAGALAEARRVAPAVIAVIEHPFASGRRVDSYFEETPYSYGGELRFGGIHRPLGTYVHALEAAGLRLRTLRELPHSLVLAAVA